VVAPGDRIVTSGQGGLFPPGLPVGTVASIERGVVRIAPLVDFDRLEIVRIVDYSAAAAPLPAAGETAPGRP
jgi:rod shape-determining protein MreC